MIEHVEIIERSTVVLSLRGYLESLRLIQDKKLKIGGGELSVADEIKRAHKMIDRFTNKWIYLSDEVLDVSKLYRPDIIRELKSLVDRASIIGDGAASARMKEIAAALVEIAP